MTTDTTPPHVDGKKVTTKVALTYVAGQRELLVAQKVNAMRLGSTEDSLSKLNKAIASMEIAEAALKSFVVSGKSAYKAGLDAGFVPYKPSVDGGRRPSVLPGRV